MIMPLFPMFISALGGGGVVIGLIGGLGESISSLLKILAGYWSDRSGRRLIFVFSGYTLSALAKLLFPVATSWSYLLVLKPSLYP
jgi:MFS family permease